MLYEYTFLNLVEDVLNEASHPLTCREIWQQGQEKRLAEKVQTGHPKPWVVLSGIMSQQREPHSKFIRLKVRPARYFLGSRQSELTPDLLEKVKRGQIEERSSLDSDKKFHERDLHPLLAYVAYNYPFFSSAGGEVYLKTILHEKTGRGALSQWMHPDMVGVYFPFDYMEQEVIALNKQLSPDSVIQIFSFELKKKLTTDNYRESYFQAVSNSSWAHTGYLVAAEISGNDDLHVELERLSNSFGIGVFHLDLEDIDSSDVIYPAKTGAVLDWETINKLCQINGDFHSFIETVRKDLQSGRAYRQEYDAVPDDPAKHIRAMLKKPAR